MDRQRDVVREVRRVLKPQGRAVFTTWEDDLLPDLTALLGEAGFSVEAVEERSEWLARERAIFERALQDAPSYPDDSGLLRLADEAGRALPIIEGSRRVIGVAVNRLGPMGAA